jgi:hypothetical protein
MYRSVIEKQASIEFPFALSLFVTHHHSPDETIWRSFAYIHYKYNQSHHPFCRRPHIVNVVALKQVQVIGDRKKREKEYTQTLPNGNSSSLESFVSMIQGCFSNYSVEW